MWFWFCVLMTGANALAAVDHLINEDYWRLFFCAVISAIMAMYVQGSRCPK